ncbi:MAG: hypothetical protein ACKVIH_07510 [Burkholderiales bacterium]
MQDIRIRQNLRHRSWSTSLTLTMPTSLPVRHFRQVPYVPRNYERHDGGYTISCLARKDL